MKKILIIFLGCVICLTGCNMSNPVIEDIKEDDENKIEIPAYPIYPAIPNDRPPECPPLPEIPEYAYATISFNSFLESKVYEDFTINISIPESVKIMYGISVSLENPEAAIVKNDNTYYLPFKGWEDSKGNLITETFIASQKCETLTAVWGNLYIEETNEYFITDKEFFYDAQKKDINADIYLLNDLDFNKKSISPINSYTGYLNGNGHSLKNLFIEDLEEKDPSIPIFSGLFRKIENSNIKNIVLVNLSFLGIGYHEPNDIETFEDTDFFGSLVGYAYNTTFESCHVTEAEFGTSWLSTLGGMVGKSNNSSYIRCSISYSVFAGETCAVIGGLVGRSISDDYESCVTTINVFDNNRRIAKFVGGLIGFAEDIGIYKDCISKDNIFNPYYSEREYIGNNPIR